MLTVTLANYEYPPHCGGGGVFTSDLADQLRDRGHDVRLVVDERDTPTESLTSLLSWPVRSLPTAAVTTRNADVLNGHFAVPTSLALPAVARATDTPLVVNCMGADVYDPTRYGRVRPALDAVLRRWVGPAANALVVPSQDMRERLPDALQAKSHVIPYFVDTERFTPGEIGSTPPCRLLTVARLVSRKHLALALEAVAILREQGHDVTYTVAGDGPLRDGLEHAAEVFGVDDAVTFLGYAPDEDLPDLYRAHDVFVLPSRHEAFGIAAVEALASGLPVVATNTGGHAELVDDACGVAVEPTASAVANGIASCISRLPDAGHAARERATERYAPDVVLDAYERLYREVADG